METKYKVGDYVTVRKDLIHDMCYNDCRYISSMGEIAGVPTKIIRAVRLESSGEDRYYLEGRPKHYYSNDMFEEGKGMRKLTGDVKVFDILKGVNEIRSNCVNSEMRIGTVYSHGVDEPQYICTGVEFKKNGDIKSLSCRRLKVSENEVRIGIDLMHTTFPTIFVIAAYDGVAYIEKLLTENSKKAILEKQIAELEAKLDEMKSEVKSI